MKKILIILLIFTISVGCSKDNSEKNTQKESFYLGTTIDDGRVILFTLNIPYKNTSLDNAFVNNEITIEEFVSKLKTYETLRDGGSKIYYYDKSQKEFGKESFYVINCNSVDNIKNVYIAKNVENLYDKCILKIDDLENVSMTIKEGSLTTTEATIIITDNSNRKNIYGNWFKIQKKENNNWIDLKPKNDMLFTSIGYTVDENNKLELKINWELSYGELENGEYRILKNTSESGEGTDHYITAEFTI